MGTGIFPSLFQAIAGGMLHPGTSDHSNSNGMDIDMQIALSYKTLYQHEAIPCLPV